MVRCLRRDLRFEKLLERIEAEHDRLGPGRRTSSSTTATLC